MQRNALNSPGTLVRRGLNRLAMHVSSSVAFSSPFSVLIETTNRCNLRCPLCPVGDGRMVRERGDMSLELFQEAIDQVASFKPAISLCNFGETFLYPHLLEACAYAKKRGLIVDTTTNCQAFPGDDSFFEDLVGTGIDVVKVALDGVDESTLRIYRRGASFERARRGIQRLVAARARLNSVTPAIPLQFVLMKHNQDQVNRIKALGEELGVDEVLIKSVFIDVGLANAAELAEKFLPDSDHTRIRRDSEGRLAYVGTLSNKCPLVYDTAVILRNGDVSACCHDYNGVFKLGNIRETPFCEIWNGAKYRALRRQICRDRNRYSICRTCTIGLKGALYKVFKCRSLAAPAVKR